jgi:hypothetical protein
LLRHAHARLALAAEFWLVRSEQGEPVSEVRW